MYAHLKIAVFDTDEPANDLTLLPIFQSKREKYHTLKERIFHANNRILTLNKFWFLSR